MVHGYILRLHGPLQILPVKATTESHHPLEDVRRCTVSHTACIKMPGDMTMKRPNSRTIRLELYSGISKGGNDLNISPHWAVRSDDRAIPNTAIRSDREDEEGVPVKVEVC